MKLSGMAGVGIGNGGAFDDAAHRVACACGREPADRRERARADAGARAGRSGGRHAGLRSGRATGFFRAQRTAVRCPRARRARHLARPARPDPIGSRNEKADGSVSVSAGQRLPTAWETKLGVEIAAPGSTPDAFAGQAQERGAGWANLAVPAAPLGLDKATIDARVDPNADQGKLSTALSRSVPVGGGVSVTLQNGYAVTQSLANPGGVGTRAYSGDGALRLELPTATALSAGARISSTEEHLLPSVSAEQKLFDTPLSVTGTISQRPTGETDRSITAGFKKSW
jgi:hypothetical protein